MSTRARAEGLVKHQREQHCRQRLVATRCTRTATGWDCRWRTVDAADRTILLRHYGNGIPVQRP